METLNNLILKLTTQEKNLVRSFLAHLTLKKKGERKVLHLFEYLLREAQNSPDNDACSNFLYGKKADGKFRMVKSKLRASLIDCLTLSKNLELKQDIDPVILTDLSLRKRISAMKYLFYTKGASPMVEDILEEVLRKGKKYQNYGPMLDALKLKKYLKSFVSGVAEFDQINKEIVFYEYCIQSVEKANEYYYKLITRTDFQANTDEKTIGKFLLEAIEELNRDFKYTRAGQVGYYLKQLEIAYFHLRKDYSAARNSCVELLSIIREFPSVYRKARVGIAFDMIGECDLFLKDYEKSISNFTAAQKMFPVDSRNYLISKELLLKVYFYSNSFVLAERTLSEIGKHPNIALMGDFRSSKYPYYNANIFFKRGKFKEALKEITQQLEIAQDRSGWGIHQRVLAIMCNVELQRFDQATLQVEALVRQVDRMKKEKLELGQRDALIVKFLVGLSQKGFMYSTLKAEQLGVLERLALEKEVQWKPLTPELIPFHEWIGAKVPAFMKKQQESKAEKGRGMQKRTIKIIDREN